MSYKMGELFCGPGGLALAATRADIGNSDYVIKHAWATDFVFNSVGLRREVLSED
jgi:DNA (cytosine-5)-methyltransferase 1